MKNIILVFVFCLAFFTIEATMTRTEVANLCLGLLQIPSNGFEPIATSNQNTDSKTVQDISNQPHVLTQEEAEGEGAETAEETNKTEAEEQAEPPKPALTEDIVVEKLQETDKEVLNIYENTKNEIDKATQDVTNDFQKSLDKNLKIIEKQYDQTRKKAEAIIKSEGEKGIKIIQETGQQIKEDTLALQDTVDQTIETNISESITLLGNRIDKKQAEYDALLAEANSLQATLPPPDSICELYIDCAICAANPECGWCANENVCMAGDKYGSTKDICKVWDYRICRGECAGLNDCESCLSNSLCGWCQENRLCLERPPTFEGCGKESWFHKLGSNLTCPTTVKTEEDVQLEEKTKEIQNSRIKDIEIARAKESPEKQENRKNRKQLVHMQQKLKGMYEQLEYLKSEYLRLTTMIQQFEDCVESHLKQIEQKELENQHQNTLVKNENSKNNLRK